MAIDFPSSPSLGQTFIVGGLIYVWDGTAWNLPSSTQINTARRGNRIVNPSMQISQENGNTAVGNSSYPADQWLLNFGGFTSSGLRSQSLISPDGSPNSLMHSFSATRPSPAAADYVQLIQYVEGQNIADLEWGTAKAKPALLRFNAACETAGTYTVSVRSSDQLMSWLGGFTCDGTLNMKTYSFAIPAQQSGVWNKDSTVGALIAFCYASGSTYGGGVAGWQSSNKLALAGQTNGATVTNKNLVITDVGLYVDPDNTGVPPPFEQPDPIAELLRCQRYWETVGMTVIVSYSGGVPYSNTAMYKSTKRISPTLAFVAGSANGSAVAGLGLSPLAGFRQTTFATTAADVLVSANARM